MRILALETSTEYCSVALWRDGDCTSRCELVGQKHSEVLIEMLDGLLRDEGTTLRQLDGIAFGAGPGSFTGVRIACGVAQGLALGAGLPVAGVSTLLALAQAAGRDKVIAALDARMGEIYHAAYRKRAEEWVTVCEPGFCLPQAAPAVEGAGWFGTGSGFKMYEAVLDGRYAGQLAGMDRQAVPQAGAIAELAAVQFAAGQGVDAAQAVPVYLRDKVALKTSERERPVMPGLREMNPADVDAAERVEQRAHAHPWTRGNLADALDSGYLCRVMEQESAMLGYVVLMLAVDEAQLLNLTIAAEHQRKGLGRALLAETLNMARDRNMRRVLLEVRPSNIAALGLYRAAGFREIGLRRGYYQADNGREDAIVMECLL
ncbi:MAG: tRNA (adenosine(37)-N6)-threonylcarbamoyltransferase complex dimerization subunit type 1 TsaB [Nitrosomonadales bacterium]|nr:tRNA (adenosine(37)-N6)-threonylcarbamoyltransferase complex dimerization subunit type 1 TsaB [Nitrosomonadales bacterium]